MNRGHATTPPSRPPCTSAASRPLQNAERYAPGSPIEISLDQDAGRLSFTVHDHGAGFDVERATEGEGFQIMRDRMAAFGGVLTIESAPGEGTTVTGTLPARVLEVAG